MPYSTSKSLLYTTIIVLFFIVVLGIFAEVLMRLFNKDFYYHNKAKQDFELGWVTEENQNDSYEVSDYLYPDSTYLVKYQTHDNGFREWGDINSLKPKVLFIGDSYVHAIEVGNDDAFYNILGSQLNAEVFAYGASGYGTLQQMMVFEKYFPIIKPNLIVWQTCDNDLINNHLPLEHGSNYTVAHDRPFLGLNGKVTLHSPLSAFQKIIDKSKFLQLLRRKMDNFLNDSDQDSPQALIAKHGKSYKPYVESLDITTQIIKSISAIAGTIPLIAFSASAYEPQMSDFKKLWENENIPFLTEPGVTIRQMKNEGLNVISKDGYHWNRQGHQKVAEILSDTLSSSIQTPLLEY